MIEELGRYIDGTLQDRDVHVREVEFTRVPSSGRDVPGGWACDFDVLFQGQRARITVSTTEASTVRERDGSPQKDTPTPPDRGGEKELSPDERHELECLRHQVQQLAYPCSPHCAGYLRELALRNAAGWRPLSSIPPDLERVLILLKPERYGVPIHIDEWDGFIGAWKQFNDAEIIGWQPLPPALSSAKPALGESSRDAIDPVSPPPAGTGE